LGKVRAWSRRNSLKERAKKGTLRRIGIGQQAAAMSQSGKRGLHLVPVPFAMIAELPFEEARLERPPRLQRLEEKSS